MFSDRSTTSSALSTKTWLWGTAILLVILCQLLALRFVALGQVQAAELRQARLAQQRVAVAQCVQNSSGAARNTCISQSLASSEAAADNLGQVAVISIEGFIRNTLEAPGEWLKPVAFTARQ